MDGPRLHRHTPADAVPRYCDGLSRKTWDCMPSTFAAVASAIPALAWCTTLTVACAANAPPSAQADAAPKATRVADVADSARADEASPPLDGTTDAPTGALAWAVDKPGPHRVGFRALHRSYTPVGLATARTLTVNVWYPTAATQGAPAAYLLGEDPEAFTDAAPVAPTDGKRYPVHVFTHGHQGYAGSSPHVARRFASHGWVVAAPEHVGNTIADSSDRPTSIYWLRSADVSATLDALAQLAAPDPLAGKLDTDHALLSGHSFGGFTVFLSAGGRLDVAKLDLACSNGKGPGGGPCAAADVTRLKAGRHDPRIVAALPMATSPLDAAWFGAAGLGAIAVPLLAMTGSADGGHEGAPVWPWLQGIQAGWAGWLDIAGGCHQVFGLGPCKRLPETEGVPIVQTYALAFGRRFVLGDTGAAVGKALAAGANVDARGTLVVREK